jgi:hypothetical protein
MKTRIIYITEDGKEFDDVFRARRHECELTQHTWEYFNENMGLQKARDEKTRLKFCKTCSKQVLLENGVEENQK